MSIAAIRAILFDKDGTLFDFHASWARPIGAVIERLAPDPGLAREMAAAAGLDPVTGRFRAGSPLVAGTNEEIARLWARFRPDLGAAAIAAMLDEAAGSTFAQAEHLAPAVPDLAGHLAGLRAGGLRLGVATHDSERAARAQLGAVGALEAFDFIAGYDSGHGAKPGPGMLAAFAAAVALTPAAIAVVGDSRHDLEMARAGGAGLAIGVLTGPATEADLAPLADHVLPSIAALPALLGLA